MRSATALLRTLNEAGLRLEADGGRLVVEPASKLTAATRDAIRAHKGELLEALLVAQLREDYAERAAIGEYDGELSRPQAEMQAFEQILTRWLKAQSAGATPTAIDTCVACSLTLGAAHVSVLRPGGGLVHANCIPRWRREHRNRAAEALAAGGIPAPAGWRA
jgi:TubC N-terminal docking domain